MNIYAELVNRYPRCFKRANVSVCTLEQIGKHCTITETHTRRDDGKITEKKTETVSAEYYAYVISSIEFFMDRIAKSMTPYGRIATKFTTTSPDGRSKITREYEITYNG